MNVREIFKSKPKGAAGAAEQAMAGMSGPGVAPTAGLAEKVLDTITEGVIVTGPDGIIKLINPAAVRMTGCGSAENATGLSYLMIMKFETGEGVAVTEEQNKLVKALGAGEALATRDYVLITMQNKKVPVAITMVPAGEERLITFRDITKELEEEGAQTEFISTASHEMRTPVASIEGYLGLALNPQTATIDERARKYLEEAHQSSQHLGRLFQDLLDVTKLDDKKMRVRLTPVDMVQTVKSIADGQAALIGAKKLSYTFGSTNEDERRLQPAVYGMVDIDFLREILNNLIENAIKYTPEGGAVWVNVRGDGDRILINVTDTGIGISPDDLTHIFQKFYRVDNSQTREIGGTGLGLYLVKQRAKALGGKVWAESSFGDGSTFFVSLPRLTAEEYERQKQLLTLAAQSQMVAGSSAPKQPSAPQQPAAPAASAGQKAA